MVAQSNMAGVAVNNSINALLNDGQGSFTLGHNNGTDFANDPQFDDGYTLAFDLNPPNPGLLGDFLSSGQASTAEVYIDIGDAAGTWTQYGASQGSFTVDLDSPGAVQFFGLTEGHVYTTSHLPLQGRIIL